MNNDFNNNTLGGTNNNQQSNTNQGNINNYQYNMASLNQQNGGINNSIYQNMNQSNYGNHQNIPPNINSKAKNNKSNKKMVFIIGGIILISILAILFIVFNKKDDNITRTFMIYMVGSNLETDSGLGTVDLNSIDYDEMDNKNVKVVLIAGGAEKWHNSYIEQDETSIYELTASGYEKVKTQSVKNMGSARVLSDYLNYVYDNYHTDEYSLIFWNHGGAIYGSEFDDLSGDLLSLSEMNQALSNSKFNKSNKLETIMFRTCLNGTIEVASVFKDYAKYLIASEEITLGSPLSSVLNFINEIEPTDKGIDVGIKFINSYKNQIATLKSYYGSSNYIYSTYSIVDLSKVSNLIDKLNDFINDINISQNYNQIAKVRSNLYQYAYHQASDPTYDTVDLYNLVDGLKELSPTKAADVLDAIDSTVVYNWATNKNSRGISIYFPYNGSKDAKEYFLSIYDNFDSFDNYNSFISTFYLNQSSGTKKYSFDSNPTNVTDITNEKADFTLELTNEQLEGFAKAEYLVFMDKGEGYYWPVYLGRSPKLEGNILKANINGNHLKVTDQDDKTEYVVPLFETYNEEDYIKYNTTVILEDYSSEDFSEWKSDVASLSLIYDRKSDEIKIGSLILNETDENKPNTVAVNLTDYEYIAFGSMSHKLLDENGNVSMDVFSNESNGIFEGVEVETDKLEFKLSNFDDENDYYCVFRIYDTNNNHYYSKLIKMN